MVLAHLAETRTVIVAVRFEYVAPDNNPMITYTHNSSKSETSADCVIVVRSLLVDLSGSLAGDGSHIKCIMSRSFGYERLSSRFSRGI